MAIENLMLEKSIQSGMETQESQAFVESFFEGWNQIAKSRGDYNKVYKEINYTQFVNEYTDIQKSLKARKSTTGAGTATGSGLIHTEFMPLTEDMIADVLGGAFAASGAQKRINSATVQFTSTGPLGRYVAQTSNPASPTKNEVSPTYYTLKIAPEQQIAEVEIYDAPVLASYTPSPAQLISVFRTVLELTKEQREDEIVAEAVTGNANVAALPVSSAGRFGIAERILKARMDISVYGRPTIYMNEVGFYTFLNERDGNENFSINNVNYQFIKMTVGGDVPRVGKIGTFVGCPVVLVPEIKNTYTVNGSNVVTGQTGGNRTVVMVGIPRHVGIVRGPNVMDYVSGFTGQNSRENAREGVTSIIGKTFMNGGVINPTTWAYYAFQV